MSNLNIDNRLNLFGIIFGLRINVACWTIDGTDIFNIFICNGRHKKIYETAKVLFEFKVYKYTYQRNIPKRIWHLTILNKTWTTINKND